MTTPAQIRKAALTLPDVVEVEKGVFEVCGVPFATVTPEKILRVPEQDDVALDKVNGMQSNALVRQAWFAAAPEDLADRLHAADAAVAGQVGDLPKSIGTPATRALVQRGITCLADLEGVTEDELASWHGVGPKAVRILGESR
ncbi:hypothetical protein [Corynebacterium sp.]|uniref:hypothetical protein n=1 Tax=Corynebacterium sp. TaxID=1720 RepID=UPI0028AE4029|nr:hypothetical protein [Corynebacterium sp.]